MKTVFFVLLLKMISFYPSKNIYLFLDVWIEQTPCWAFLELSDEVCSLELSCPKAMTTIRDLYLTKSSVVKTPKLKFYQVKTGFYRLEALENGHYKIQSVKVESIHPDELILDE